MNAAATAVSAAAASVVVVVVVVVNSHKCLTELSTEQGQRQGCQ